MPSIVLSSTSFINGGLISPTFKNNSVCEQLNRSPQFSWTHPGLIPAYIDYYNLYVENQDVAGSSPNGKFVHWGVHQIDRSQLTIPENGGWYGITVVILPTDYTTGDKTNGWNGPCASTSGHTYRAWIEAHISEESAPYVWGEEPIPADGLLRSNYLTFFDNNVNVTPAPTTADCGNYLCPEGYELVEGICQEIILTPAVLSEKSFLINTVTPQPQYGFSGTRFYANCDQYNLPLRGKSGTLSMPMGSTDAVLQDTDGIGVTLPFVLDNTSELWGISGLTRLNVNGVWNHAIDNEIVGVSVCMPSEARVWCVGVGGDKLMQIKVDGNIFARFDRGAFVAHYQYWHVVELNLGPGEHIIEIIGYGDSTGTLGFEIYKCTLAELMNVTTRADLESIGYNMFKSKDYEGDYFTIGNESGYICPNGFAYNACDRGSCIDINYLQPNLVKCCWVIQNCTNEEEQYNIEFDSEEGTTIYLNNVYSLNGSTLFAYKCFIVIDRIVCDTPQMEHVMVSRDFGASNCAACSRTYRFQICNSHLPIQYITMLDEDAITLIEGNVYRLDIFDDCCVYIGSTDGHYPNHTDVSVLIDYQSTDCAVCDQCLKFLDCATDNHILVHFAEGQVIPGPDDMDTIYLLGGDEAVLGKCWKFQGYGDCLNRFYIDITVIEHKECTLCANCTPYYQLINCADAEDIIYIYWDRTAEILLATSVYVFDFASDICYKPVLQFTPCENIETTIYNMSNVVDSYENGCIGCAALCYKLIDCAGEYPTVATDDDFAVYVGRVIRWEDETHTVRCAWVQQYSCREETYITPTITVLDCFVDCGECNPPVIAPEFSIRKRAVAPGYTVPECSTGNSCVSCGQTEITHTCHEC